jgi:hypothetical protein
MLDRSIARRVRDAAGEHERLQHVVGQATDEQQYGVDDRWAGVVFAACSDSTDHRQRDEHRR